MKLKTKTLRAQFMFALVAAELIWLLAAIAVGVIALQLERQEKHETSVLTAHQLLREHFDEVRKIQMGMQQIALGEHTSGYATLTDAVAELREHRDATDERELSTGHHAELNAISDHLLESSGRILHEVETAEGATTTAEFRASRTRLNAILASVTATVESAELLFTDMNEQFAAHRAQDEMDSEALRSLLGSVLLICAPLALIFPFLLMTVVARRFTRGIGHLLDSVSTITAGDLSRRATPEGPEEVATLARKFNTMAERLEASTDNLNQTVALQTVELRQAAQALGHRNKELEEITHAASHDLREPLRSIVGFGELMEMDLPADCPEQVREELRVILAAGRRMQSLVGDLLDLSNSGRQQLRCDVCDLTVLAREVIAGLSTAIGKSSATVKLETLPVLEVDPTLFSRVLQHLIGNALEYQPRGQPPVVHIHSRDAGDFHEIVVADNGIGIAPEYHEKIFHAFRRLHRHEEHEGSGIGLAACRRTIERHGGRIGVESAPGAGSRFIVSLPKTASTAATTSQRISALSDTDDSGAMRDFDARLSATRASVRPPLVSATG
jgi:signal transduction histidine kinase